MWRAIIFGTVLLSMLGCGEESDPISPTIDAELSDAKTPDAQISYTFDSSLDAAMPDAAMPDAAMPDAALEPNRCDELGMPRRSLKPASGFEFGDLAGDFTVNTLAGSEWSLSAEWTGCESYVFLVYIPDLRADPGPGWGGDDLWNSDLAELFEGRPETTRYFFVSLEEDAEMRRARMERLELRLISEVPGRFPKRVHLVTDRLTEIEGSVGDFARDYMVYVTDPTSVVDLGDRGRAQPPLPFVFGIDRQQRWDAGGNMSTVVGRTMTWRMASYLGPFYDHLVRMADAEGDEGVTILPLVDERSSEQNFNRTILIPQGVPMGQFDTLKVDVSITCPYRNVFACNEWDRIARVWVCEDPECMERQELVRWITPYWRRGERRWHIDASPVIGLLRGGMTTFRIETGTIDERHVKISLRFSNEGGPTPVATIPAFTGADFNADYNTREPVVFTPPIDATKVELIVIISGHGQTEVDNCAEWCDHQHTFTINGHDLPVIKHEGEIGSVDGCARHAGIGAQPGQFGNWAPERAFWCPGLPVQPIRIDLTDWVHLGVENQLTYSANLEGNIEPRGGYIILSSYVVSMR